MAKNDQFIIKLKDPAQPDISVRATKQGGTVAYSRPRRPGALDRDDPGTDFYVFEELNAADTPKPIRVVEVHKDEILAIINEPFVEKKK